MKTELKTKPAKTSTKPAPKAKPVTKPAEKAQTAPAKKHVFALVAGTVANVTHKGLAGAVRNKVNDGLLKKVEGGYALTQLGADLWNKDRVNKYPALFQEVAEWMHAGAARPACFGNGTHPDGAATPKAKFPCILYWGRFSTDNMRAAFAAIWAK